MLATAEHLVYWVTGQVDGRVAGDADIAAGQSLAFQRLAQDGGGAKDGVAFGHGIRVGGGVELAVCGTGKVMRVFDHRTSDHPRNNFV